MKTLLIYLSVIVLLLTCCKEDEPEASPSFGDRFEITEITTTSAKVTVVIESLGSPAATEWGVCCALAGTHPTISDIKAKSASNKLGEYSVVLEGLEPGTEYLALPYAIHSTGVVYGPSVFIYTKGILASLSTREATDVRSTSAKVSTTISSGVPAFTDHGICYATTPDPTIENSIIKGSAPNAGVFTVTVNGLTPNTKYYVRAYATNKEGPTYGNPVTAYGNQVTFTTPANKYAVGDVYGTGTDKAVVFYVDATGGHGWVVALKDLSKTYWADGILVENMSVTMTTDKNVALSDINGYANTQKLRTHNSYMSGSKAYATAALSISDTDFSNGWYLPALGQLQKLGSAWSLVNNTILSVGGTEIAADYYWSSTEYSQRNAWHYDLKYSDASFTWKGMNSIRARAVRSF